MDSVVCRQLSSTEELHHVGGTARLHRSLPASMACRQRLWPGRPARSGELPLGHLGRAWSPHHALLGPHRRPSLPRRQGVRRGTERRRRAVVSGQHPATGVRRTGGCVQRLPATRRRRRPTTACVSRRRCRQEAGLRVQGQPAGSSAEFWQRSSFHD